MRVGYFGPEGTFTHEALIAAGGGDGGADRELVPFATIYDTVMAVHHGEVERALVPIENSLEGSVNATLDALAMETEDVAIVGEVVHPIRHCLIARGPLELSAIEAVVSHPQATAQCARFIRSRLPQARVLAGSSTADAVRMVAEHDGPWAALGNWLAAERYGCEVLRAGVEDVADNETRFVWLGHVEAVAAGTGTAAAGPGSDAAAGSGSDAAAGSWSDPATTHGPQKTAIVFWGVGSEEPGWLVRCLTELASRDVNMTRIESRPRKQGLGRYMFFVDFEGGVGEPQVGAALDAVRSHVEALRVLGSFPAA
ncbi:MAG TPA: prephenate dehydratase [Solirubrobacteraceae bacterium]|nr:prephenate dehydratase [Solirubrobacteraceae bacterium]